MGEIIKHTKRQLIALANLCRNPSQLDPKLINHEDGWVTILSIDADPETLSNWGRPVWHASISVPEAGPINQWPEIILGRALLRMRILLHDAGDLSSDDIEEFGGLAYHLRRETTDEECALAKFVLL